MQVGHVETVCVFHLLSLDLELQQMQQLAALFKELGCDKGYESALQRLFEMEEQRGHGGHHCSLQGAVGHGRGWHSDVQAAVARQ